MSCITEYGDYNTVALNFACPEGEKVAGAEVQFSMENNSKSLVRSDEGQKDDDGAEDNAGRTESGNGMMNSKKECSMKVTITQPGHKSRTTGGPYLTRAITDMAKDTDVYTATQRGMGCSTKLCIGFEKIY